jgi:hypothetical protein
MSLKKWLYRGGHPNAIAKVLNQGWAWIHSLGISPNYLVTLEVVGRESGKAIRFPLAMTVLDGRRYLVSMLGTQANWVRNVQTASGRAVLLHGKREEVQLEEVDMPLRAPILKAYLQIAPGARPHLPVDKDAPLSAFEEIAPRYPVFLVIPGKGRGE